MRKAKTKSVSIRKFRQQLRLAIEYTANRWQRDLAQLEARHASEIAALRTRVADLEAMNLRFEFQAARRERRSSRATIH